MTHRIPFPPLKVGSSQAFSLAKAWLCVAAWTWGALGCMSAHAQSAMPKNPACAEHPLAFRSDITPPDPWEKEWEDMWPNASSELSMWRVQQFAPLLELWRATAPLLTEAKALGQAQGLPPSAAYLALWSVLPSFPEFHPNHAHLAVPSTSHPIWVRLGSASNPRQAMQEAHEFSGSNLPFVVWANLTRTALRLMENFDLPPVHVVEPGETVYSIARLYDVPPSCLGDKNDVWDNLQPGTPLLIPNLSSPH